MPYRETSFTVLGGLAVLEALPDRYTNGYLTLAKYPNKLFAKFDGAGNPTINCTGEIPADAPRKEFTPEEVAQVHDFYAQKKAAQEAAKVRQAEAAKRVLEQQRRKAEEWSDFEIYD